MKITEDPDPHIPITGIIKDWNLKKTQRRNVATVLISTPGSSFFPCNATSKNN